jgi:hypothetical protein
MFIWKEVPSATSNDETKMEFISGNADDVHKNAARTSCRPKRTLITRNEDLLWAMLHIKNSTVDAGVRMEIVSVFHSMDVNIPVRFHEINPKNFSSVY